MRSLLLTMALFVVGTEAHAQAVQDTVLRDQIATFMQDHVLNRPLSASLKMYFNEGNVYTDATSRNVYTNLHLTSQGMTYNMFADIKQTLWDVVDGQNVEPGRDVSRIQMHECEVRRHAYDDKHLIGHCRPLAVTGATTDVTGSAEIMIWSLVDGKLVGEERSSIPSACYAARGAVTTCMSTTTLLLEVIDGKLQETTTSVTNNVDPVTWAFVNHSSTGTVVLKEE